MSDSIDYDTLLIENTDKTYPIKLLDLGNRHKNISFGPTAPIAFINNLGYSIVNRVEKPVANVVMELAPVIIDGEYFQAFEGREFTEEELKVRLDAKKQRVINSYKDKLNLALLSGYEFTHNERTHYLQLRDKDYVKLLFILRNAQTHIESSNDTLMNLRVASNEVLQISPIEMVDLIEKAFIKFESLNNKFFELETEVKSIELIKDLVEIKDPYIAA